MQKPVGSPKEEKIGDGKERCVMSYYTCKLGSQISVGNFLNESLSGVDMLFWRCYTFIVGELADKVQRRWSLSDGHNRKTR